MIRLNTIPHTPKDIRREAARRILLLDGGLGTMIQRSRLGERAADATTCSASPVPR